MQLIRIATAMKEVIKLFQHAINPWQHAHVKQSNMHAAVQGSARIQAHHDLRPGFDSPLKYLGGRALGPWRPTAGRGLPPDSQIS